MYCKKHEEIYFDLKGKTDSFVPNKNFENTYH